MTDEDEDRAQGPGRAGGQEGRGWGEEWRGNIGAGLLLVMTPVVSSSGVRAGTEELWGMWCCSKAPVWPQKGPGCRGCTHTTKGSASPGHDVLDKCWEKGQKSATALGPTQLFIALSAS